MPHCIIECSADLPQADIMQTVFNAAVASALFEADGSDIKVRLQSFEHYLVGRSKDAFIHVTVRILAGRSQAQQAELSTLMLEQLKSSAYQPMSITIEIVEMAKASYRKYLNA